jgi:hypothetical protein
MKSPNPAGRPRGIVDKRSRIAKAFMDDAENIAKKVVEAALAGNLQAANIVLSRCQPVLKSRAEKVTFTLDPDGSLTEQARAAVAAGEIDPETGRILIEAISSFGGLKEVDELRSRLDAIDARSKLTSAGDAPGGVLAVESQGAKLCLTR